METIMVQLNPEYVSQSKTMDIQPNGKAGTYRLILDYRSYVGKYFATVINVNTGEDVLRNFPLVASEEESLNDLLKQVSYKLCGALVFYPLLNKIETPNMPSNIAEYELLWGDSPWTNLDN